MTNFERPPEVNRTIDLIDMLRNDMRRLVDSQCARRGHPGPAPNFSTFLLSLVACENVGLLTAPNGLTGPRATRAFIEGIAQSSGNARYRRLAGPRFGLFRHGIAHQFMPKQFEVQGVTIRGAAIWHQREELTSTCIDLLHQDATATDKLRTSHLLRVGGPPLITLFVSSQMLYLDVDRELGMIKYRLMADDPDLTQRVVSNLCNMVGKGRRA